MTDIPIYKYDKYVEEWADLNRKKKQRYGSLQNYMAERGREEGVLSSREYKNIVEHEAGGSSEAKAIKGGVHAPQYKGPVKKTEYGLTTGGVTPETLKREYEQRIKGTDPVYSSEKRKEMTAKAREKLDKIAQRKQAEEFLETTYFNEKGEGMSAKEPTGEFKTKASTLFEYRGGEFVPIERFKGSDVSRLYDKSVNQIEEQYSPSPFVSGISHSEDKNVSDNKNVSFFGEVTKAGERFGEILKPYGKKTKEKALKTLSLVYAHEGETMGSGEGYNPVDWVYSKIKGKKETEKYKDVFTAEKEFFTGIAEKQEQKVLDAPSSGIGAVKGLGHLGLAWGSRVLSIGGHAGEFVEQHPITTVSLVGAGVIGKAVASSVGTGTGTAFSVAEYGAMPTYTYIATPGSKSQKIYTSSQVLGFQTGLSIIPKVTPKVRELEIPKAEPTFSKYQGLTKQQIKEGFEFHHIDYAKNEGVILTREQHKLIHNIAEGRIKSPTKGQLAFYEMYKVTTPKPNRATTKTYILGLETPSGRALTFSYLKEGKPGFGTPNLAGEIKQMPVGTEIKIGSALETKAIKKSISKAGEEATTRAKEIIPVTQRLLGKTRFQESKFINEEALTSATERLPKAGVDVFLKLGKEEGGILFGSKSRAFKLAQEYNIGGEKYVLNKVPRDIELRFDYLDEPGLKRITEKAISDVRKLRTIKEGGKKFELGTAREIKGKPFTIEAKVNGKYEKIAEFKGGSTEFQGEDVPEFVVGIRKVGIPKKTKYGITATTLSEELRGTAQGVLRLRTTKEGKIDIFPPEKRMKDIGSVSVSARTLEMGKGYKGMGKDIEKFESLFPEELVREQVKKAITDKEVIADYSYKTQITQSKSPYESVSPKTLVSSPFSGRSISPSKSISKTSVSPVSYELPSLSSVSSSSYPSYSTYQNISESKSTYKSPSPSISISPSISPSPSKSVSPSPSISPSPSKSVSPSPSMSISPFSYPKTPPEKYPSRSKSPGGNKRSGYQVLVRRGGVFKRIGFASGMKRAFILGKRRVQTTAGASFKIKPIGKPKDLLSKGKSTLPKKQFYESKKEKGVFIQKKQFRISTAGEKGEITLKGIQASRNKRKKGLFS